MKRLAIVFLTFCAIISARETVFKKKNDLNFALLLHNCRNGTSAPFVQQSIINSAIWTIQRLNFLSTTNLNFGISIYELCQSRDYYEIIFELFQKQEDQFLVGFINERPLPKKIKKITAALELKSKPIVKCPNSLIKGIVALLSALQWNGNITVIAPNEKIVNKLAGLSQQKQICITKYLIYDKNSTVSSESILLSDLVVFGDFNQLNNFVQNLNQQESRIVFAPLDGSVLNDLPPNSYIITPQQPPLTINYNEPINLLPTPLLFEVASPFVSFAQNIWSFIHTKCNETVYKLNCLRNCLWEDPDIRLEDEDVVNFLKIEPLKSNFIYNIFKSNNNSQPYNKLFSFNIFSEELVILDSSIEVANTTNCINTTSGCEKVCEDVRIFTEIDNNIEYRIRIRSESWVFAFLSISLLGTLFCLAILIFLLISIGRRDILDGNPVMTILLLLTIFFMYFSIFPLCLESDQIFKETLCLSRSLSITLSFASAFSLILSRSILIATASKDIGFMSHIAGPVQAFLSLFIFGVQAALSLQPIARCTDFFRGYSFIYLLSYNLMLLLLLLCLCPLIAKCPRNYCEGKYFTITAVIISFLWCFWVPFYAMAEENWKDPLLCFGLVSTASTLVGTIFVPRTYLMTIAQARNKITSTLPSLATATSAMDIYRTGSQPVYDCVNVAAINAVTVARAGITTMHQPDLYSCSNLPEDEDYERQCGNTLANDKITRF